MKHLILVIAILAGAAHAQQRPANCLELKKVKIADHVLHQKGQTQATLTLKVKHCEIIEDHQQTTVTFESLLGLDVTLDDIAFRRSEDASGGNVVNRIKELEVLLTLRGLPDLPVGESTLHGMLSYQVAGGGAINPTQVAINIPFKVAPSRSAYSEQSGFTKAWVVVAEIVGGIILLPFWLIYCPISRQCG